MYVSETSGAQEVVGPVVGPLLQQHLLGADEKLKWPLYKGESMEDSNLIKSHSLDDMDYYIDIEMHNYAYTNTHIYILDNTHIYICISLLFAVRTFSIALGSKLQA